MKALYWGGLLISNSGIITLPLTIPLTLLFAAQLWGEFPFSGQVEGSGIQFAQVLGYTCYHQDRSDPSLALKKAGT